MVKILIAVLLVLVHQVSSMGCGDSERWG